MMDWLRQMIGLPEGLRASSTPSTTAANHTSPGPGWGGRTALRFAVGQTTTTEAHVTRAWERIAAIARAP